MHTYDRIWRKRHFLPCWIVQGICVGILGVLASLLVGASTIVMTAGRGDDGWSWLGFAVDDVATVAVALGSVLLAFCFLTLALNITEAILYKKRQLSPTKILAFACIKTIMWLIYFLAVVVMAAKGSPSPLDLIMGIILVTTSISQIVLGAIYVHKQRKELKDRGNYADIEVEGGKGENMASIPRSKTWRRSIPAITINSREWDRKSSIDTGYESYRHSLMEAEKRRESRQELDTEGAPAAETQTLASSNYDASTWTSVSPPPSPGLTTVLSHPPVQRVYSPAYSTNDEFAQADLTLTGFYGAGVEGETRRF